MRSVSAVEQQLFSLRGRCVLVTGGSRGIGRAACIAFAQAGADVAVHYHTRRVEAEQVAAEVETAGQRAAVVHADVTRAAEVETMMRDVAAFVGNGGLHVLFNNAGVYPSGSLESLSVEEWDRVMGINARGTFPLHPRGATSTEGGARGARNQYRDGNGL